ncbi:rod shape-determining protein MreD [Kroppenstedtia eburnea]|uniref:Rod shape-determining protein MreD n=1 Tax=Kroppenstedtia eburnea TaxID=714067 RepID=A0A1N7M3C4_9BACL|nr:rod shape-determining protein MreD [Kroppenstedtia eburnea]EGK14774.1 rod shape-determining protein MreD [Desmospora sp. 8437]QKI81808.1 rod shape-determining protein MreD [Kroppenstedtia eburnea]SIS80626.1 rod shape-determining protein MreD [Kroppenstedtia eburnea]
MAAWMLTGFLSFLFLLEGTVLQDVAPQAWGSPFIWIPQPVTSGIIILSLIQGRKAGLIYGLCFGLIHDLVFGQVIGVYAFSTAAIGYMAGQISRQFVSGPIVALFATGICQAVHLLMVFGWYRLFNVTQMPWDESIIYHIIPSVLINTVVAYPVYRGIRWIVGRFHPHSVHLFDK